MDNCPGLPGESTEYPEEMIENDIVPLEEAVLILVTLLHVDPDDTSGRGRVGGDNPKVLMAIEPAGSERAEGEMAVYI